MLPDIAARPGHDLIGPIWQPQRFQDLESGRAVQTADERHFIQPAYQHIGGVQRFGECLWIFAHGIAELAQDLSGGIGIGGLASIGSQAQELPRHHAIAGGRDIVLQVAWAHNQRFVIIAGVIVAAIIGREMRLGEIRQLPRDGEPALVEGRLIELEHGVDHIGVIFQVGIELAAAVLVAAHQATVFVQHALGNESAALDGRRQIIRAFQNAGRFRQAGQHHAIPGCQDLVIQPGRDALLSRAVELGFDLGQGLL